MQQELDLALALYQQLDPLVKPRQLYELDLVFS